MMAEFINWIDTAGSPQSQLLRAERFAAGHTGDLPLLLGSAPYFRGNPYQDLLYQRFGESGMGVFPLNPPFNLKALFALQDGWRIGLHLHWLASILDSAKSLDEGRERIQRFIGDLTEFKERGGKIVWTVHNLIPHDSPRPDLDRELRVQVCKNADLIHLMTASSLPLLAKELPIDASRVILAPHPSYQGAYPDYITREEARKSLGIEPDEIVIVLFSALKAYKGIETLIEAFDLLRTKSHERIRLLLAGASDKTEEAQALERRCLAHPDILIAARRIPSEHVQIFLRSADLAVAPYVRTLNSGAVMLYQTFGLPVVIPAQASLRDALAPESFVEFEGEGHEALAEALVKGLELVRSKITETVTKHAEGLAAKIVSTRFAAVLRERLFDEGGKK